jgi:hypothetical protein
MFETIHWPNPLEIHAASGMPVENRDRLHTLPCRSVVVPGTTQTARPSRAVIDFQPVVAENSRFGYLIISDDWKMRRIHLGRFRSRSSSRLSFGPTRTFQSGHPPGALL